VDDTFVVWPHRKDELQELLKHLSNSYLNITFTEEVEQNKTSPFLDVLVSRSDGPLGHSIYRQSAHMDLYLHAKLKHHPAQRRAILTALVRHARTLCNPESLQEEFSILNASFTGTDTVKLI
jgi:hypothetical protein